MAAFSNNITTTQVAAPPASMIQHHQHQQQQQQQHLFHPPNSNHPVDAVDSRQLLSPPTHQQPKQLDKKELVQHQLILLLHAHKCSQRLNSHECQLPLCSTMKDVLLHIQNCHNDNNCPYNHCTSSKNIIEHYKTCQTADCPVCKDIRRERHHKQHDSSLTPFCSTSSTSNATSSSNSSSSQSPPSSCLIEISKPWHAEVKENVRAYVVSKLEKDIQSFLPQTRWSSIRLMAERIERESYETAQSREEYFLIIAQKVFASSRQSRAASIKNKIIKQQWSKAKKPSSVAHVTGKSERRASTVECVICLEDFKVSRRRKQTLTCRHVFHSTCIKKWLSRSGSCPLCRAPGS